MSNKFPAMMSHPYSTKRKSVNCNRCGFKGRFFDPMSGLYISDDYTIMYSPIAGAFEFNTKFIERLRNDLEVVPGSCKDGCEPIEDRINRLKKAWTIK